MNDGEKQKNSIEPGERSEKSELKQLESDFVDDSRGEDIEIETPEERMEKISQAKAKVKESYKKNDTEKPISIGAEIVEEKSLPQEQMSSTKRGILSKYDATERSRVDRIKSGFNESDYYKDTCEKEQIASRPSTFTKAVRLIADRLGIKTKKGEERREREAMYVALSEHHEEEVAKKRAYEEREKAEALERERRSAEDEAKKARREEEALASDMAWARHELDDNKRDRLKKQRIQEMVERDLNSRLLTVDNLETEVLSENPEVQKRLISFRKHTIPVYDLKGLPFSLLSTAVDYRRGSSPDVRSAETHKRIMKNPWIWGLRRDEVEKGGWFFAGDGHAMGDTICTSYWNSERNINSHWPGELIYGFENVRADSVIEICSMDGSTGSMSGCDEVGSFGPDIINSLEDDSAPNNYNEVTLRRYSENGMPKRPDYIIVENGIITKAVLRSAAFFGIPIVNVERSVYEEKAEKRGEELLASISENDTYEEMNGKIKELLTMSRFKSAYRTLYTIGRNNNDDIPWNGIKPTPLEKRCFEVSKMELLKRLDFIRDVLEEATRNIESATERGLPMEQGFPGFEYFSVSIMDVQKNLVRTENKDKYSFNMEPGNCNCIDIMFKTKGSSRDVKTAVLDGKRIYKAEEVDPVTMKEYLENGDSSFYDALEPVVLRYFEAVRKNKESMGDKA